MELFLVFIIWAVIAFIIAYFLGRKRQIGFGWSLFFCFFLILPPIGGLVATLLSRKHYAPNPTPSKAKKIWGWVIIVLAAMSFMGNVSMVSKGQATISTFTVLGWCIGFIGLGFYLIELSKGKNFNSKSLTKIN